MFQRLGHFLSHHRTIRLQADTLLREPIHNRQNAERTGMASLSLAKPCSNTGRSHGQMIAMTRCRRAIFRHSLVRTISSPCPYSRWMRLAFTRQASRRNSTVNAGIRSERAFLSSRVNDAAALRRTLSGREGTFPKRFRS